MKWFHHWNIRSQTRITSSWGILLYGNFCTNQNICWILLLFYFFLFSFTISIIVHKRYTRFVCKSLVFFIENLFSLIVLKTTLSIIARQNKKKMVKKGDMQIFVYRNPLLNAIIFFYPFFSLFDFVFSWMDYILLKIYSFLLKFALVIQTAYEMVFCYQNDWLHVDC